MRIEKVQIHAFGAFSNRVLTLAPGMTVVFGTNESGKSTWHAAIYAALCGIRRGKGQPRSEDREFALRHRPWEGNSWVVVGVIALADGTRVELRHDLDGKVDCRATELAQGHDVSDQIIWEGSPDGSRWLGLDRRAFQTTACVSQAHILDVLHDANALQTHLQRAAATAGTDATAAAALALLQEFHSEQVGLDRANSTRPLRRAKQRLEAAKQRVQQAHSAHDQYLTLVAECDALQAEAQARASAAGALEAAIAVRRAIELEGRLQRAVELHECLAGKPAPDLPGDEALAQSVVAALQAWSERPELRNLSGATAAALRIELERLPAMPNGDLEPAPGVVQARNAHEGARQALEAHLSTRPKALDPPSTATSAETLRDLARDLEVPEPAVDAGLKAQREAARGRVNRLAWGLSSTRTLLGGVTLVTAGLLAVFLGYRAAGIVAVLIGLSFGGAAIWRTWARLRALEQLQSADALLGAETHALDAVRQRRHQATTRAATLGLPAEPAHLRQLAAEVDNWASAERTLRQWETVQATLQANRDDTERRLRDALGAQGMPSDRGVAAAFAAYVEECSSRAEQGRAAARRPGIEHQLKAREAAEQMAAEDQRRRDQAERGLREIAPRCDVTGADDDELAGRLREWLQKRSAALKEREAHVREETEFRGLLEGGTLEELRAKAAAGRRQAEHVSSGVEPKQVAAAHIESDRELHRLRGEATETARRANQMAGQVATLAQQLQSVAEAEEEEALAEAEHARVRTLDETISQTQQFLQKAQERVHRDIAPVLAGTLRGWLPRITGGRYQEVIVDPATLNVKVSGASGLWREASLLSYGTCEQIYLLLRMAMVQHLTKQGEICPLILDEVTVQCDTPRTVASMELLHEVSRERQVIVFTQEDDVREWAKANLEEPQDRFEVLDAAQVPA